MQNGPNVLPDGLVSYYALFVDSPDDVKLDVSLWAVAFTLAFPFVQVYHFEYQFLKPGAGPPDSPKHL